MNWEDRIKSASSCGRFTDEDIALVGNWRTDPVGERLGMIIPTGYYERNPNSPSTYRGKNTMARAGIEFQMAVCRHDTGNARDAYYRICSMQLPPEWKQFVEATAE